jgi:hypothetical protein
VGAQCCWKGAVGLLQGKCKGYGDSQKMPNHLAAAGAKSELQEECCWMLGVSPQEGVGNQFKGGNAEVVTMRR